VFIVVCVCRHRRRAADGKSPFTDTRNAPLRRNGNAATSVTSIDLPPEYPVSSVQLISDVCDDHRFRGSRVYLGQLALAQRPCRPVVVRTLDVDADERTRSEFWFDVDALHALRHPHVAAVVGVTGRSVVGAASSVLLECGPELVNLHQYVVYAGSDPVSLDHSARLRIAVQIAAGMDYLSTRGVVHGDLACRSVLMISTPGPAGLHPVIAKLCVGLSLGPTLFSGDYQQLRPDCPSLPVRWMSPEAIASGGRILTTSGDVWSYGVTLWELYSAGCRPYEGFDDDELVQLIITRQLLPCPPPPAQTRLETSRVYSLMVDCWASEPADRPTFADILVRLEQWQVADVAVSAGRHRNSTSRSNSTRSNSETVPPRRSSPFQAVFTRAAAGSKENQVSTVVVPQQPPDAFQHPLDCPPSQGPPAELNIDSKLTSRSVNGTAQPSHHSRRLPNDHSTPFIASNSSERRQNDRQLPQSQPTDVISLRTVDVL